MKTDTDEPREHLPGWFELVDWFYELPGRVLRAIHRFCHRWEPDCPACAANLRKADDWANNCRTAEELLAAERAKGDRGPVTDADIAAAYGTLLTGQTPRLPQPNINQVVAGMVGPPTPAAPTKDDRKRQIRDLKAQRDNLSSEIDALLAALGPRKLTYPEVVAMQKPKGPPIIPEGMKEAARTLACPPADSTDPPGKWGRVNRPVAPLIWTKGEVGMGRLVGASEAQR